MRSIALLTRDNSKTSAPFSDHPLIEKASRQAHIRQMITPEQIRGARAMAGLTQAELAKRAGVSATTLNEIERGDAHPKVSTLRAIQAALESAGVEFIAENGGGPGVRLKTGEARGDPAAAISIEDLNSENDE
jgi:DNA-binding XRE family transcriptional regulator